MADIAVRADNWIVPGESIEQTRIQRRAPRVLLVSDRPPIPADAGDRQRTQLLFRALAQCAEVRLLLLGIGPPLGSAMLDRLGTGFNLAGYIPLTPRGARWPWRMARRAHPRIVDRLAHNFGSRSVDYQPDPTVARWLDEYLRQNPCDLAVSRYLQPAARSGVLERLPVVLDIDDIDTAVYETRLSRPGLPAWQRPILKRHLAQLRALLPERLAVCRHIWVASDSDRAALPGNRVSVLPNIPFSPADRPIVPRAHRPDSRIILTVGSLTHRVNVEGIDRFVQRVWPAVFARFPDARFRIVGSGMTQALRDAWSRTPGVEAIGFAEDLSDEYAQCAFTVAPLFEGGGTKIKVLESLAYGRTAVVTPHAQRGYESALRHEESLWVAPDEDSLVRGCTTLLAEPESRERMARIGSEIVEREFSFDRFAGEVRQTIDSIM